MIGCIALVSLGGCGSTQTKAPAKKTGDTKKYEVPKYADRLNGLEGVWEDPETHSLHTVQKTDDGYIIVSIVNLGDKGETVQPKEIKKSEWKDGALSWSYYIPATGYTVNFKTVSLNDNKLLIEWSNDDGRGNKKKGYETMKRMMDVADRAVTEVSDKGKKEDLSARVLGKVYKLNGSEVVVAISSPRNTVQMGDVIFVVINDEKVFLDVVFPMQTVSKCRLQKKSTKFADKIKTNMPVYR
jgi:hypothetical protein